MLIIKVFDPILDLSGLLGENLGAGRGSPGAGQFAGGLHGSLEGAQDGNVAQEDVARREQGWQGVGGFTRPVLRGTRVYEPVFETH
jgi:hypothetical protein